MRLKLAAFTLTLFLFNNANGTSDSTLINFYRETVYALSADSMGGRAACSGNEKAAAAFIEKQMGAFGFKPLYQSFSLYPADSTGRCIARNIYCFANNHKDSTLVIGAHYDHIGYGGVLSKSFKAGIHYGADDNASGVALLLGLLMNGKQWMDTNYNYLFVAYSGHETGLFGSKAFAEIVLKKYRICGVLNFDMVGRMDAGLRLVVLHGATTFGAGAYFSKPQGNCNFRDDGNQRLLQLDTRTFYQNGVPCLSVTTGIHDDYHKVTDTADKINFEGILLVQRVIESYLKTCLKNR